MAEKHTDPLKLPFHGYSLAEDETFQVYVYKDHPEWDRRQRWFQMPDRLLAELFVAGYDCDSQEQLDLLEIQHPGHVFVY